MATIGTDDAGGPKASEISKLRSTAKWRDPPEEIEEEDDFLTGEELKLFQSVAARFTLYSVKELMRKMASPCAEDLIALKRVARYTTKYPRMACKYLWTPLDGHCRAVERSVCESMVQNDGRSGPQWWRIRTGSSCQGRNRRFGIAIDSERL